MKKCSETFFFPFYELLVQVLDLTTLNRFETLEYLDVIYVVLRRYSNDVCICMLLMIKEYKGKIFGKSIIYSCRTSQMEGR
jgi:hypothetical protein